MKRLVAPGTYSARPECFCGKTCAETVSEATVVVMGTQGQRTTGRRWQRMRAAVLSASPLCRTCAAAGRSTAATEVDHVVPLMRGGSDDWDNLQPLCHDCHADKTERDMGREPRTRIGTDGYPAGVGAVKK